MKRKCVECDKQYFGKYDLCDKCFTKIVDKIIEHSPPEDAEEFDKLRKESIGSSTTRKKRTSTGAKTLG